MRHSKIDNAAGFNGSKIPLGFYNHAFKKVLNKFGFNSLREGEVFSVITIKQLKGSDQWFSATPGKAYSFLGSGIRMTSICSTTK